MHFIIIIATCSIGYAKLSLPITTHKKNYIIHKQCKPKNTYHLALKFIKKNDYHKASALFLLICKESFCSFSLLEKSIFMRAICAYKLLNYQNTIQILDNFLDLHEYSQILDKIYYLKMIAHFYSPHHINFCNKDIVHSLYIASLIKNQFSCSKYNSEIAKKIIPLLEQKIACKTIRKAKFHILSNNPLSAIIILQNMLKNTDINLILFPEILYYLIKASFMLNLDKEVLTYYDILHNNFLNTAWCQYAKNYLRLDV